ncbi:hypothetical protein FKW86_21975, partial [Yersinia pestis]
MKKQILATLLLGALFCVPVYAAQIVAVTASGHDSEKGHVPANIADVLSCADNPSNAACQRGIAENKAYIAALATGSVA